MERRYQTAYILARSVEVISWLILAGGFIAGLALTAFIGPLGLAISAAALVFGLMLVFSSQLTLMFIDTEHNTRQALNEAIKTNAMLAETLGTIAANLNRMAERKDR